MIKAIIFDIGGVVIKTNHRKVHEYVKNKSGADYKYSLREYHNAETGKLKFETILKKIAVANKLNGNDYVKIYKFARRKFTNLDKKIVKMLGVFRKNYKLYVLSNTNTVHKVVNKKLGVYDFFNRVFLSTDMGLRKPDLKIYRLVLKKTGLKPQETVFIDDKKENIFAANKIGINGILFENYSGLKKDLKKLGIKW